MTQSRSWWTRPLAVLASSTSAVFCLLVLLGLFPQISQAQTDTTVPTIVLTTPTPSSRVADLSSGLSGTTTDAESGVTAVTIRLFRNWLNTPNLYWNGTSWQSSAFNLAMQLGTANGAGTRTWTVTTTMPQGSDLIAGRYGVFIQAKNGANLSSSGTQSPYVVCGTDTTGPQLVVDTPAATGAYDSTLVPSTLSGTVKDPLNSDGSPGGGVATVFARFSRSYNGFSEYWNPTTSSWTTSSSYTSIATLGSPDANGVCSWSINFSLPPAASMPTGAYNYWVEADDRSYNITYTQPAIKVLPVDTTAPQGNVTTPDLTTNLSQLSGTLEGLAWDPDATDGTPGSGVARVQVYFYRTYSGSTEYWTGSAWGANTLFNATLGSPNANDQVPWSASPTLPSGTNLPAGHYTMGLAIRDRYNNPTTISTPFSVGSPDSTAPTVSITTPTDGSLLNTSTQTLGPVSGSASDGASGSGVSRVRVQVMRNWTGTPEYWNGSVWGASAGNGAYATLAAPDANGTLSWSLASGSSALPPAAQLPSGTYTLNAIAYDRFDNTTTSSVTIQVLPQDSSAPTVSITTPSEGAALTSLPSISGTASDSGSGLTRVDVLLSRITTNGSLSYWTGSSWSGVQTYLSSRTELGWTRSTNLPSGSNLIAGAYIISATAYDRYGNASTTATRTFGVVQSLDALIAAGDDTTAAPLAESAYAGKYIINSNGTNQVANASGGAGSPIDFSVKVHKYGGSDDVTFTAPALDNGWSAAYYDANGVDITSAVTGTGWVHAMLTGEEAIITVEVTPPTGAAIGDSRDVLIQASASGQTDVVKATATVRAVGVPDVSVKRITGMDAALVTSEVASDDGWTGLDVIGSTQSLSAVTGPGLTERYAVRIKNAGTIADAFMLHLSTPTSGWTLHLFDAAGQPIGTTAPTLLALPSLAPGASTSLTLEAQSSSGTTVGNDITVSAVAGANSDAVTIHDQMQSIAKLQWSIDGTNWSDVSGGSTINAAQADTIALRVVKSLPDADWPDAYPVGPEWTYNGDQFEGDDIRIHAVDLTGTGSTEVTVICGNGVTINVHVGDSDAFIKYDTE